MITYSETTLAAAGITGFGYWLAAHRTKKTSQTILDRIDGLEAHQVKIIDSLHDAAQALADHTIADAVNFEELRNIGKGAASAARNRAHRSWGN